jgi:hypothetical protein
VTSGTQETQSALGDQESLSEVTALESKQEQEKSREEREDSNAGRGTACAKALGPDGA